MLTLLHVGCGGEPMPEWAHGRYVETRLDVSPEHSPDIVCSMTEIGGIGPFDAVACSHALEHVHSHEALQALRNFVSVLKPGGAAVLFVPDLEDVRPTDEVLFTAPCGPLTGLDLIYGHRGLVETMPYMAHKCGFTAETLEAAMLEAGFSTVTTKRLANYNLMAVGIK